MNTLDDLKAHAPNAADYLTRAGQAIMSATLCFDYARSAEKMVDPNCSGDANPAWQNGPFLTIFQGAQPVGRTAPSVMHPSVETNMVSHIINGDAADTDQVGLPQSDDAHNQIDHMLSKMAIIEQVELMKGFLFEIGMPCPLRDTQKWDTRIAPDLANTVKLLLERRDELLKDPNAEIASMREAVDIFYAAVQTAAQIAAITRT